MTAAAAACEALLDMEGQMLGHRSNLGHRALLVFSFKVEQDQPSKCPFVQGLKYLGSPSDHCPPCMLFINTTYLNTGLYMAANCIFLAAMETFLPGMFVALVLLPLFLQAWDSTSRVSCIHRDQLNDSSLKSKIIKKGKKELVNAF